MLQYALGYIRPLSILLQSESCDFVISLVLDEQTYAKLYAYVHIIIYQLCLKIVIWFTSDNQ
jgi:hypothetical protein